MRLSHQRPRASLRTTQRAGGQRGYILVTFALLLVPLLLMVGLSVDVGSWYQRSSDIQKAADAAALAGVVWLPDFTQADRYAREAAKRNGFWEDPDDPDSPITVSVTTVPDQPRQLRVTITDDRVGSFFYENVGGRTIDLSRTGTAEYVLPVPLGSPENQFGGVDGKSPGTDQPGLWGNIHGYGTDNSKGDAFTPKCTEDNCSIPDNPLRRESGYRYIIKIPKGGVNDLDVQVYDPGMVSRSNEAIDTGDKQYTGADMGESTTLWSMERPNAGAILDVDNYLPMTTADCSGGAGQWSLESGLSPSYAPKNEWSTLCRLGGPVDEGQYVLRVSTEGDGSTANRYAVRALTSGSAQARVYAYGDMSMYNNIASDVTGAPTVAEFYLAEVADLHGGKTLQINMFDPGEVSQIDKINPATGSCFRIPKDPKPKDPPFDKCERWKGNGQMSVINKDGQVASSCVVNSDSDKADFSDGETLSPCTFATASDGKPKFNGYWVNVAIKIPNNYVCTSGTVPGCWWKIRYEIEGQGNDTTTWEARVTGDPVHLTENS